MAKGKSNMAWVIIVVLLALVIFGAGSFPKIDLTNFNPFGTTGGDTGLVNVDKQLKFSVTDKYAGSARGSISSGITVYDDSLATLETLSTGSDGTVNSAFTYPSGKHIYVKWNDANNDMWFDITVPKMNSKDAEAATYNNIPLKVYQRGTYTTDDLKYQGTAISDSGNYNFSLSGSTMTFTLTTSNTGSDNTGLMESYDPIYKQQWQVWVYITFSGTNYETVLPYGFDSDFTLGTTHYVAKHADTNALTKWKIGNDYVQGYNGVWTMQFSLDGSGYVAKGTGLSGVTMQIEVKQFADPVYAQNHGGNFGVNAVELNEITVTLRT